ncbi:DMT family transporter [Dongia rigui]|uniref:DMT family transporter n=1 Tax=Dongia rigui TaxID=940149 RepID=A0ABU5DUK6_9PROT|nr:DMT family transporter [Dongia rigui]MDY0870998.1 DMT family transporter [Dongia rigui]
MKSKAHGYLFALAATTIFSFQDAVSKHLGDHYPPIFITMIRYWAFGAFCILIASRRPGGLRAAAQTTRPVLQIMRGVLLATEIMIVITSFAHAGLAHSTAVLSATPLVVTLLSIPLLGEHVGWRRWSAIIVGLIGVLLILKPDAGGFLDLWLLLPVVCCFMYAIYLIATRLVSRTDTPATSFFYIGVAGAATATLVGPFFWTSLEGWDKAWMALLCVTGMTGHYLVIRAYELLDASAAQPISYLGLVYASLFGVLLYGETLTWNILAGSIIVVAAGIFTFWREYRLRHQIPDQAAR